MKTAGPNSSWHLISLLKCMVSRFVLESYESTITSLDVKWLSFACNYVSFLSIVVSHIEAHLLADIL